MHAVIMLLWRRQWFSYIVGAFISLYIDIWKRFTHIYSSVLSFYILSYDIKSIHVYNISLYITRSWNKKYTSLTSLAYLHQLRARNCEYMSWKKTEIICTMFDRLNTYSDIYSPLNRLILFYQTMGSEYRNYWYYVFLVITQEKMHRINATSIYNLYRSSWTAILNVHGNRWKCSNIRNL